MGSPATILGQFSGISRGTFTSKATAEFPGGGIAPTDQKPVLNWAMEKFAYSERIGGYLDIGATDVAKDLDVFGNSVVPLYLDNAIAHDQPPHLAGINPPKAVFIRCLVGSGFLYLNVSPGGTPPALENKQTPFPLHAGLGMFYYAFPKREPWRTIMTDGGDPTKKIMIPSVIINIALRTFEASNRFYMQLFR